MEGEAAGLSPLPGQRQHRMGPAPPSLSPLPHPSPPSRPFLGREALVQNPGPGGTPFLISPEEDEPPAFQPSRQSPWSRRLRPHQGFQGEAKRDYQPWTAPGPFIPAPRGLAARRARPAPLPVAAEGPERSPAQRPFGCGRGQACWAGGGGGSPGLCGDMGVSQPAAQTVLRASVGTTLSL